MKVSKKLLLIYDKCNLRLRVNVNGTKTGSKTDHQLTLCTILAGKIEDCDLWSPEKLHMNCLIALVMCACVYEVKKNDLLL